jgi:hypothetical protein
MAFFGDRYGTVLIPPPSIQYIPMSTAIARIYTPEGFVVAADGRTTRSDTLAVVCDSTQKVFRIEQPGRRLAYALAGAIQLTHVDGETILFDFLSVVPMALDQLATERYKSLWHYADSLGERISDSLEHAKEISDGLHPSTEGSETHIFLDGYYEGRGKRLTLTFMHHIHERSEFEPSTNELYPGQPIGYGSEIVRKLIGERDPRIAAYCLTPQDPNNVTLSEAIRMAENQIRAHYDPEIIKLDEKICSAVGGDIHIATVTFANGFQWVPGFEWPRMLDTQS